MVGARLIAHTGSLLNLAKYPASTVQILGAEKALFRALKTKHETPKYGLIYHASLVGQAAPKFKGKISRVLAAKAALSIRVDALGDKDTPNIGAENRVVVENRLRQLEGKAVIAVSGQGKAMANQQKYGAVSGEFGGARSYNAATDDTTAVPTSAKKAKRDRTASTTDDSSAKKSKSEEIVSPVTSKASKRAREDTSETPAKKEKLDKAARKAEKAAKKAAKKEKVQ